jgi:hypothetical protein
MRCSGDEASVPGLPDGVWVTAQEITLDFKWFCFHRGCGPSEGSYPVDAMKSQREAITGMALCWADPEPWMKAGSELWPGNPGPRFLPAPCKRKCWLLPEPGSDARHTVRGIYGMVWDCVDSSAGRGPATVHRLGSPGPSPPSYFLFGSTCTVLNERKAFISCPGVPTHWTHSRS